MTMKSLRRRARRDVLLLLGTHGLQLQTGIAKYAREANWMLEDHFVNTGLIPTWWRGDGILALITNAKDAEAQRQFPNLPLVDFSKGWISDSMPAKYRAAGIGRPRVYYDNPRIGALAADHFVERGFKHIAFLNVGNYWMEIERIDPFRQVVEHAHAQYHELDYYKHVPMFSPHLARDEEKAYRWLVKALIKLPKPLGVAASSDRAAVRVLRACSDAGLKVPEEVAVLGCHNESVICECAPVPLSSVDDDLGQIGYVGAKLLGEIMAGKSAPREPILIPPKGIVTRMSTNILAVPDENVARALRFILDHHHEPIGAPEVAIAAGLSRSGLDRAFKKHLGRSPAQEILHVRVAHAKNLLVETSLKLHEIAVQVGFSGGEHFSHAFHGATGIHPSSWRHQHSRTS